MIRELPRITFCESSGLFQLLLYPRQCRPNKSNIITPFWIYFCGEKLPEPNLFVKHLVGSTVLKFVVLISHNINRHFKPIESLTSRRYNVFINRQKLPY